VHLVGSYRPGRQLVVKRVPSQSRPPHRVSPFESPRGRATNLNLSSFRVVNPNYFGVRLVSANAQVSLDTFSIICALMHV
jgi:hypothetical protein